MNISLLGGIIFVVVFAGIILIHELGHFIAARLFNIDVEEFAIGFPPRLLRLWRSKGSILIGKERLVLPVNYDLPFDPKVSLHRPVNAHAKSIRGKLVLLSISLSTEEGGLPSGATAGDDIKPNEILSPSGEIQVSEILNEVRP